MIILLCIVYAISLAWYMRRSLRQGFAAQLILKTVTSTLFVLIAWACYATAQGDPGYFVPMLLALVFSLFGDVFIQLQRRINAFTRYALACGVGAFFVAHCLFAAAFSNIAPFSLIDLAVYCVVFVGLYLIIRSLHLDFGRVAPLCMLYLAAIVLMFTKALSAWYAGGLPILAVLLPCGGALFIASDFMLTLKNFYPPCNRSALVASGVTLTYYLAQLVFALSLLYAA